MESEFERTLPAVWLVFGGTYLNHTNAPKYDPDNREQLLVNLLHSFVVGEMTSSSTNQFYDSHTKTQLAVVCDLLKLWSEDLSRIYKIRQFWNIDSEVKELACLFLKRVRSFTDCMIIPNGLISAGHAGEESAESVSVGILTKKSDRIDWIQVDPGSAYHQHCEHVAGEKCNAYLEILDIDPDNITEDWLHLLVGLKTQKAEGYANNEKSSYQDMSLYEGLLSHLNGKTVFKSKADEGFIVSSHASPVHTWHVVNQSFRYLLRHFLADNYYAVYQQLLTNFKMSVMKKTLAFYQDGVRWLSSEGVEQRKQCHFLLQEMCRDVAQYALDYGNEQQKASSLQPINAVEAAIKNYWSQQEQLVCPKFQLKDVQVSSLSFDNPNLVNHRPHSFRTVMSQNFQVDPVIVMPKKNEDIIDYLKRLKSNFISKLKNAHDMHATALLSYGIEEFFFNFLAETDILEKSPRKVPTFLAKTPTQLTFIAKTLEELGGIYYGCQSRLVNDFLANSTYQPQFYAKNVTIQFFVYAAVAALNYRDPIIGPLLEKYNLSTVTSASLKLENIILQLVIEDYRWLKILSSIQSFFTPKQDRLTLFSAWPFTCEIRNDANKKDTQVAFAYELLQKYPNALETFTEKFQDLEDERLHLKWRTLAYTESQLFLPSIYCVLFKVANLAKVSLTGFPSNTNKNFVRTGWKSQKSKKRSLLSKVMFTVNDCVASTECCSDLLTSYLIKQNQNEIDPYQKFITSKEKERGNGNNVCFHFLENDIIANQDGKPGTMDSNRYMLLGFLQSEPWIKLERLYIALKEKQLDFSCEQDAVLVKQTLFEISLLCTDGEWSQSLLQWTVDQNPDLIHKFGLLCIKKALGIECRLSQHLAIGEILLVSLGLLTFYPAHHKNEFIDGIIDIYSLLKKILANPPAHLSDNILLHLNAYLIIAVQAKPQLLETETLTILKALVVIQNYKVKGAKLTSSWLLQIHVASFKFSSQVEEQLALNPTLLNDLMLTVVPTWDSASSWKKNNAGLLFTLKDYAIKPLLGCIFLKNHWIMGLPDEITEHTIFKEFFGEKRFTVRADSRQIDTQQVPCYLSVCCTPELRLTLVGRELLVEERMESNYECFVPAEELLSRQHHPSFMIELPNNGDKLFHWLNNDKSNVLIKDKQRTVVFKWDLTNQFLFSTQHGGYVVPWKHVQHSDFKMRLKDIESANWIELIAQPSSNSSDIHIKSLNFPRLGLHFYNKDGKFCSKQVHGYVIAEQQRLNTLHGFSSYLVLELQEKNLVQKRVKVIIPHRNIMSRGRFYVNTTDVDRNEVRTPAYFVYDYDSKMGLLKGHHIRAHLYLALLYFRSASFDEDELSHCNAYHLARENLEMCWKDQPYDNIELSIIEQLLDVSAIHQRGLHTHLCALYLKVVSLLSSSLRLSFLFTDETTQQNKKRSDKLLERCAYLAPHFLVIYLQNKSQIFARIRLTEEEEKDAVKQCSPKVEKDSSEKPCAKDMKDVENYLVYFLPSVKKCYNTHYQQFFSKQKLITTCFQHCFEEHLSAFNFALDTHDIYFGSGIQGILKDRFRIVHFISLYNMAKTSAVSIEKYRYLLHHLLLRAKVNYQSVEAELVMMLGRALLLVAENPAFFPDSPSWLHKAPYFIDSFSVNLAARQVMKTEVFKDFPPFSWPRFSLDFQNVKAKEEARKKDKQENERIWLEFESKDLDRHGIPCALPEMLHNFTLRYESCSNFSDISKLTIVRKHYLRAACNDSMYQFFTRILQKCDELKHASKMGWTVAPFVHNSIKIHAVEEEKVVSPAAEPVSLEKWATPQKQLINLTNYFLIDSLPTENSEFLFESQLNEQNGYQQQFHYELKESWLVYTKEEKRSYSWLKAESANELEFLLRKKYTEIHCQAEEIWNKITAQFNLRSNTKSNDYFALRWFSGQVRHYHKCDILRLLIEPQKISSYNPDCKERSNDIIKELLQYATHEINSVKIVNVLALIEQYKQTRNKSEQFSLVQSLVKSLQESLDPASYRYPHWFLFQLENGIIVRENQRELIDAMLKQTEKAMYQLNMGEGKSSVILPLLSCNLANGQQLLRVNVLSALLTTMKEFLRQRFSGLIKKRVYTLPFNRDTDISAAHLQLIFKTLETCKNSQHILLTTPEHRLCLQLKTRELMLENQQQIGATNIFNWETYRQRVHCKTNTYQGLNETEIKVLLTHQDEYLKTCLYNEQYIDSDNYILKIPPRIQGFEEFAQFKDMSSEFREWSCLKAAYRELLYNSTIAYKDCSEKLTLLNKIGSLTAIDLLDESDEILKHGTELNYTVGDKHVFAGGELRWQLPQFFIKCIFCDSAIREIINEGVADGFTTINPNFSSQGGVPFIQLHDKSYYEKKIKPALLDKFFEANLPFLRIHNCNADYPIFQNEMSSLRNYIGGELLQNTEKEVVKFLADKSAVKDKLLIAKGWLSHDILFHVFNAKYRVQYGLHLSLSKQIAIPFFGKDTPSPRSEFSHPDVMLGLTIISYLYQGLSQTQLKKTLVKLKDKFAPSVADILLRTWTETSQVWIESQTDKFPPELLTAYDKLDLEEEQCLTQVHKYLSGNSEGIFFYLNEYVLLEEAMQYLYKISANAHSLVGYDAALGFSGTDDRKITMPFQIKSLRSTTQEGTNGKLLSVLTQKRNTNYYSLQAEDTITLLKILCEHAKTKHDCHALIDAGALVTGLSNRAVAEFLLTNLPSYFLGILYFSDEGNSLTVLTRDKKTVSLQDCYLDKQYLFAYLDDIHTRGTDIQLPLSCHAILTVGLGMEKDKLMQAAMRLRHLAQEQSVSLWGTQAVTLSIKRDNNLSDVALINSREVIKWVTQNTIDHVNTDLFPVAVRRINFQLLRKAGALLKKAPTMMTSLTQFCQEKELFQLDEFYAITPRLEDLDIRLMSILAARLRSLCEGAKQELQKKQLTETEFYQKICDQSDKKAFKMLLMNIYDELSPYLQCGYVRDSLDGDEEKEVEVEVEVIQEQQVVIKVENREACVENQWNVQLVFEKNFILLAEQWKIIMPLNQIKGFIQVPADLRNFLWHRDIYMTANYIHSVKSLPNESLDNYLRPVDVVLMHRSAGKSSAVLLSGQEASWIKQEEALRYGYWDEYLLVHINDIDGPTQLGVGNTLSKNEQKLLTVIKLFSGECHYTSSKEVRRIAKRVGRLYPLCFTHLKAPSEKVKTHVSDDISKKLFNILVEDGFLDGFGIMTGKLFKLLQRLESEESLSLNLPTEYQPYNDVLLEKLYRIYSKLIVVTSISLKSSHETLREWVGTRGRLREYPGSELESILSSEYDIK